MNTAVREPRSLGTLGSLRQFGSGLQAGFTVFLRKTGGLWCFWSAHVRPKTIYKPPLLPP